MAERLSDAELQHITARAAAIAVDVLTLARELQEARVAMREALSWFEPDYEPAHSEDAYRWWACGAALRALLPEEEA